MLKYANSEPLRQTELNFFSSLGRNQCMPRNIYLILITLSLISSVSFISIKANKGDFLSLKSVTSVKVVFKNLHSNAAIIISKKKDLTFWKDLIKLSQDKRKLKCDSTVQVVYYYRNRPILTVYFSSRATHSKYKNSVIAYNNGDNQVLSLSTYYVSMFIDEKFYELIKK